MELFTKFNMVMALIFPSITSVFFYSKLIKKTLTFFELGSMLSIFVLFTNGICYALVTHWGKIPSFDMLYTFKYSALATFVSVFLAIIYRLVELNIKVRIKVEHRDEKQ